LLSVSAVPVPINVVVWIGKATVTSADAGSAAVNATSLALSVAAPSK